MATVTKTKVFHAVGYDSNLSVFNTAQTDISSFDNFIGKDTSNESYGDVFVVNGSRATTSFFVTFDFSEIPSNATIKSVSGNFMAQRNGAYTYLPTTQLRPYSSNGTTTFGNTTGISETKQLRTIELTGTWTRAKLDTLELRFYAQRGTSNTSTPYSLRIYGIDITVTYEYDEPDTTLYVKENGSWVTYSKAYIKQNGSWIEQTDLTNVFNSGTNYVKS